VYSFLVVSHATEYSPVHLVINASVLALVIIPKLPMFYGVRISAEPSPVHSHSE